MSSPDHGSVPALPERLTTSRLRLILITPADADDMRQGRRQDRWHPLYPREDDIDGAGMVSQALIDRDPASATWGSRHIVLGTEAVGSIGFFGPPEAADDGLLEVETGYGLVEPVRGQGLMTEALAALLAEADRLGVRVRASVLPDNRASLRLLAGAGFTELRGTDEEGQLVMVRPLRGLPHSEPPKAEPQQ